MKMNLRDDDVENGDVEDGRVLFNLHRLSTCCVCYARRLGIILGWLWRFGPEDTMS